MSANGRTTALIYIRKSKVKAGGTDPASPQLQERVCTEAAAGLGLTAHIERDAEGHRSGKTASRPGWQAVLARLADPGVGALIVYSHDRAFRNLRELLSLADRCQQLGVRLVLVKDNIDVATAQGRFMLSLLGSFGEFESNIASERRVETIDVLRRERGRHYGLAPFGTERVPVASELVLVPSTRQQPRGTDHDALRRLYELYVYERHGTSRLAAMLNAEGWRYRARAGGLRKWTKDDVRRVLLRHWIYAGYVLIGEISRGPVEVVPGSHGAILPESLTAPVLGLLASRARVDGPRKRPPYAYPLSGLLYCACGARLSGGTANGGRRYRHTRGCELHLLFEHRAEHLETLVREHMAGLQLPAATEQARVSHVVRALALEQSGRSAVAERARLEQALERLRKLYTWGDLNEASYQAQRAALLAQMPDVATAATTPELIVIPDVAAAVTHAPPAVFRDLARLYYERIVVTGRDELRYEPRAWCAEWAG